MYLHLPAGKLAKTRAGRGQLMADKDNSDKPHYKGPERRKFSRRTQADRRKEIRWEPNKPCRRQATGRRAVDALLGLLGPKR